MLEGLDSIDWQHLSHAYGPATDVPDLLRALQSPDQETREEAHTQLYISICHQGTVYEVTAYAVPFLIELLNCSPVRDISRILDLLAGIADGQSHMVGIKEFRLSDAERDTPEFKEQFAWVQRAYEAVNEGLSVYLELLSHQDADVRMGVAYLLSFFRE